jgi:hypothetical protein
VRQHYVWHKGDWVEYDRHAPRPKRTILISDSLDYVKHTATGRRYTSKSRYYADTKALGYQIVGNEKPKPKPQIQPHPEPVGRALYRTWDKLGGT